MAWSCVAVQSDVELVVEQQPAVQGQHLGEEATVLGVDAGYLLNFATWVLFWVLFSMKDRENESDGSFKNLK